LANANIKVVTLPAHSTHFTQPLDVNIFRAYKKEMRRVCESLNKMEGEDSLPSTTSWRIQTIRDTERAVYHACERAAVRHAFDMAGIWPQNEQNPTKLLSYERLVDRVEVLHDSNRRQAQHPSHHTRGPSIVEGLHVKP